jgi:hypothetical protein
VTTTQTKKGESRIDAAFEPVKDMNEQFLAAARKAGNVYLDSYETAVDRAIELQRTVAGTTQQEWLKKLIETQADMTREIASAYASTARSLLN